MRRLSTSLMTALLALNSRYSHDWLQLRVSADIRADDTHLEPGEGES